MSSPDTTKSGGDHDELVPEAFRVTANAEQYVLEADALRRRQLRSALLYGSSRFWRRKQRVWPSVIFGAILVAVICGVIALIGAFDRQQEVNEERGRGTPLMSQTQPNG
ncbi:hypothetical protein [Nocardiopsis oceani]